MRTQNKLMLVISSFVVVLFGCPNVVTDYFGPYQLDPTDITESGFTVNWKTTRDDISSLNIQIAVDPEFEKIATKIAITDLSQQSLKVDGLDKETDYYIKLKEVLNNGEIYYSNTKVTRTLP